MIPLHPLVKAVIEKYDGNLPQMISDQKFNDYIKDVCKKAELFGKVTKSMTVMGERKTKVKGKWEMFTSHIAKRSFATGLYISGSHH